ncbi:Ferric reduction oxidase [Seminavis robusta]|uniref:Ferric reduction oxidase n=1 Tax=Seminavis robusta TaxID=568900 RepID=A0A9N8EUJ2_9STRA|nr:Ferric reduction oxidase [Seminavis robusta]|eukprot:Sro2228_g319870.1 Ferric reduction oxidase (825) ;mRNA; f:5691-8251
MTFEDHLALELAATQAGVVQDSAEGHVTSRRHAHPVSQGQLEDDLPSGEDACYVVVICNSTYFWSPKNSDKDNPLEVLVCEPIKSVVLSWSWKLEEEHSGFPMWPATIVLTTILIVLPAVLLLVPISDSSNTKPCRTSRTSESWWQKMQIRFRFRGDPDIRLWSCILLIVPIATVLLVMLFKPIPEDVRQTMHQDVVTVVVTQLITSWANPTGYGAVVALPFFLVPVAKQSPLLSLLGLSPALAVGFHIWAGRICWVLASIHGTLHTIVAVFATNSNGSHKGMFETAIHNLVPMERNCWRWQSPGGFRKDEEPETYCYHSWRNLTGIIAVTALWVLVMTSWNVIRRRYYRFFYQCHIIFGAIMVLFSILHFYWIAIYLMPGVVYYWVCSLPSILQQLNSWRTGILIRNAVVIPNSNGCFELRLATMSQPRHHPAYVKLCIPERSILEWHPFTVAHASPHELRLLIREFGPFTQTLRRRLVANNNNNRPVTILVDGFYDSGPDWVQESLGGGRDTLLFVAAGIGITPVLPVVINLWKKLSTSARGSPIDIHIHWYCRDPTLVQHVWAHYLKPLIAAETQPPQQAVYNFDGSNQQSRIHFCVHLTSSRSGDDDPTRDFDECDDEKQPDSSRGLVRGGDNDQRSPSGSPFQVSPRSTLRLAAVTMIITFGIHLWWYHEMSWNYRHRIFVRGYSLGVAIAVPILVFLLFEFSRWILAAHPQHALVSAEDDDDDDVEKSSETLDEVALTNNDEKVIVKGTCRFSLVFNQGRPPLANVIHPIVESESPAVFFCGPGSLWTEMKGSVEAARKDRNDSSRRCCAWFKEHFEL